MTRVSMILPPDFLAPVYHKRQRIPPQGPAIVAASIASEGFSTRAIDLEAMINARPLAADASRFEDDEAVAARLAGGRDDALDEALEEIIARIDDRSCDVVAFSLDRGTQVNVTTLLAVELKRRWEKPIVIGGIATEHVIALLERTAAVGPDIVTRANTPPQIRDVFRALRDVPGHRRAPPVSPVETTVQLGRRPRGSLMPADEWPMADFGIYDLALYRRDPIAADGGYPSYDGSVGARLVLPYHFAYECQFSCAFCQSDGQNVTKSLDLVVRELALLSERWSCGEFVFFDAQINLQAPRLAGAIRSAGLDIRWSDSYRVRPSAPGDLEAMARGGCAAITVGVESASDRMLKKMVKGHKKEHASELVREAHAANIMLRVNLLPCFPGETRDELLETCAWLEAHGGAIDDISPSSFYLTASSPIGRHPERFGIRIREQRKLRGITKFRKVLHALEYDEVDGMSWEEREPTLAVAEDELRAAWARGRGALAGASFPPAAMVALRRLYATKTEIYGAVGAWRRAVQAPTPDRLQHRPRITAPRDLRPDVVERFAEAWRATPELRARMGRGASAHALLFPDGAFLFFQGSVTREGARALRASIEAPLYARTGDIHEPFIARCAPGATIELTDAGADVVTFALAPAR